MTTFERAVVTWKPGNDGSVHGRSVTVTAWVMRHPQMPGKWIALTNLVCAVGVTVDGAQRAEFLTSPPMDTKRDAMAWFERLCDVGLFLTTVQVDVKDGAR